MQTAKQLVFLSIIALTLPAIIIHVNDSNVKTDIDVNSLLNPDHSIRYINSMEVMQKSEKGKKIGGELEVKRTTWHQEIKEMGEKIQSDIKAYTDRKLTMSEAACEKEEKRLLKAERDYKALIEEREQDFQRAMNIATESLLKEVEKIVAAVAKQEGWDAVIDTLTGRVLYTIADVEVSDAIITAWDTTYNTNKTITSA